jgi:hypothetical protein
MPRNSQAKVTNIERAVFLLVIGALALPHIVNFFAPTVTKVEQSPPCQDERKATPLRKNGNDKVVERGTSEDAENLRPARARALAPPLPRGASSTNGASPALLVAPDHRLQTDEQDPTLGEEVGSLSWEEQEAQAQYLQEIEAMEEMLQREFDPTAVPQDLTAEEVAAIEAEMQESILREEALQPMPQDLLPDGYEGEIMSPER